MMEEVKNNLQDENERLEEDCKCLNEDCDILKRKVKVLETKLEAERLMRRIYEDEVDLLKKELELKKVFIVEINEWKLSK